MLVLKHPDGRTVKEGDEAKTFRGEPVVITGWQQPRHEGSSGRVRPRRTLSTTHKETYDAGTQTP